jgi:hypothetical protein
MSAGDGIDGGHGTIVRINGMFPVTRRCPKCTNVNEDEGAL